MTNEPQIIKTIGEQGEEIFMKLLEIVTVNDKDYALLSLVEDENMPSDDVEDEIIIMKMNKTDDDCTFEIIEDDEEFEKVEAYIESLEDETED